MSTITLHLLRFERWFNHRFGWFFTNGNKAAMALLLCTLCACDDPHSISSMAAPVIVVAIDSAYRDVVLRDADGRTLVYGGYTSMAHAIASSYTVGDTLK